jgi:hypothetical protein
MPDQRADRRHTERLSLHVASEPQGRFEIETLNVSLSGAYCCSRYFLPLMTRMKVTLILPSGRTSEKLDADAVVVRVNPSTEPALAGFYDLAFYFVRMGDAERERLRLFLRERPAESR